MDETRFFSFVISARFRVNVARTRFVGKGEDVGVKGSLLITFQKIVSIPRGSLISDLEKIGKESPFWLRNSSSPPSLLIAAHAYMNPTIELASPRL